MMARLKKLRFYKSKKSLLIVFVLIAALLATWLVYKSLSGPSIGSIYRPGHTAINEPPTYIEQNGKHVVFNYPEGYDLIPATQNQPNILETFTYRKTVPNRSGSLTLSISVYNSAAKLDEDGAYRLRKEQPDIYQQRLTTIDNQVFYIFKKSDNSETVAFSVNGGKTATIAVSGALAATNQSEAEFSALLNSWKWK